MMNGIHEIAKVDPPKDLATDTHPIIEGAKATLPQDKLHAIDHLIGNGTLTGAQPDESNVTTIGNKDKAEQDFDKAVTNLGGDPTQVEMTKDKNGKDQKVYKQDDLALTYREQAGSEHPTIDINFRNADNGKGHVIKRRYVTEDKNQPTAGP